MMHARSVLAPVCLMALLSWGCGPGEPDPPGQAPEVPAEELSSEVPILDSIHSVMHPMWHDAFPARDYPAIQGAVADFEPMVEELAAVELTGILQDKAQEWGEQKSLFLETYRGLKEAAEGGQEEEMLAFAEAFHMNYEGMVRIIRPVLPEVETFHQALYALHHYYAPAYDLEKIQEAAEEMAAAVPPLAEARLPEGLADRQEDFQEAVAELGDQVALLLLVLEEPMREEVEASVEAVHTAYEAVEAVFN